MPAEEPGAEAEARSQARELTHPFAPHREERRGLPFSGQGGQPLPASERAFFEPRLGADLSGVRLHTGPHAAAEAERLHAKAFTVGPNIYWGQGRFQPGRGERRLLGHELSHVLQQAQGGLALQRDDKDHVDEEVEGPDITDEVVTALTDGAVAAAKAGGSLMTEAVIKKIMGEWRSHGNVEQVVESALAEIENAGEAAASTLSTWAIPPLLTAIESEFILAKDTSSLDLLPGDKGKNYRKFSWDDKDYPGGDKGPNEGMAESLARDLSKIRPERRANQGSDPVITESWMSGAAKKTQKAMRDYIEAQLSPIPAHIEAPKGEKLNKHALASLEKMHADALAEGVELKILDAYREPETSAAAAEKAGNRTAVAKFSTHNLGLAIDFILSFTWKDTVEDAEGNKKEKTTRKTWQEATTNPFSNVVGMRQSPVHKWLFVRGASYGWYPYQNEPWHFEYNPTGFRDTFWSEADEAVRTAISDAKTKEDEAAQKAAEKKAAQAAAKKAKKAKK